MASKAISLILLTFLFLLTSQIQAQAPAPAPAPTLTTSTPSGLVNLTTILLEKSGHTLTLFILLKDFNILTKIQSQLNSNSQGITLFAPTDNAFKHIDPNIIRSFTNEQKVQLFLYHVTPKYYTLSDLQTLKNPVRTLASDKEGSWGLNFTAKGSQVIVTTGVVSTPIKNSLRQQFPLAVYEVDNVLLPLELSEANFPPSASFLKSLKTIFFT